MFVVRIERGNSDPSEYRFMQKSAAEEFYFNGYISGMDVSMFVQEGENLRPVDVWTI